MLAACADWPDDYDITDWSGEPEVEGEVPGADEDFPSLGSVPEPPENVSTLEEIEQMEQSLTSDLQNAQHSSGTYQRAEDEVEFEPVPVPEPEVIEEEVEEDNDLFGFLDLDGESEAEATETVETVTVVENVEVEEVQTVTSASGDLVAEEIVVERTVVAEAVVEETVIEETVIEETVVEETVIDETVSGDVMAEETVVTRAVEDEADRASPSLVAQSERDGESDDLYTMPDNDIDEAVVGSATMVEETAVAESGDIGGAADEAVVSETIVESGEPKIQVPVGSPDDALPPQAVGRKVVIEQAVAPAPTSSISDSMAAETVVVEDAVADEVVVAAAPTVAVVNEPMATSSPSQEVVEREVAVPDGDAGNVQQTFDTLFSESGAEAVSSGPGAATVTASFSDAPSPTITANGFETLAAIIRFNFGSTALDNRDREIIGQLAAIYRERGGKVRLVGYASHDPGNKDASDETLVNFKISVDRATAVADELVRQGVPSRDIVIDAQGDQAFVHLAEGQIDEAQQRRVEVYFTN